MGIESRGYYRHEESRPWNSRSGLSSYSMVTLLIVANFIVFLLDQFTPAVGGLSDFLALKSDLLAKPWMFFTLLTHGFAHARLDSGIGIWHIGGNMLALFFLGRPIEMHYGRWEFLRIYLVSIVFAGAVWLAVSLLRGVDASCVGASGAVTAVVILFALNFPKQTLLIWGILPIPAWVLGGLIVLMDLSRAFQPNSHVAAEAHLAGALFAVVYFWGRWNLGDLLGNWSSGLGTQWKKRSRQLRVHDPDSDPKWSRLQKEGDRILSKIAEQGEASLTRAERKTLTKYSETLRQRRG